MNRSIAAASIFKRIAQGKKASRRYLREIRPRSAHRFTRISLFCLLQSVLFPAHSSAREVPPTGQTQEQKTLRATKEEKVAAPRTPPPERGEERVGVAPLRGGRPLLCERPGGFRHRCSSLPCPSGCLFPTLPFSFLPSLT